MLSRKLTSNHTKTARTSWEIFWRFVSVVFKEKFDAKLPCYSCVYIKLWANRHVSYYSDNIQRTTKNLLSLAILVPRASRPRATFIGHGIYGTGSARKLAVVSKAHALELGSFRTRNNFHREVLRRNDLFVLIYFDRKFFLVKIAQLLRNSSSLRSQSDLFL
jgi:hypothetical protein